MTSRYSPGHALKWRHVLSLVVASLTLGCGSYTTSHGLRHSEGLKMSGFLEIGMVQDSVRAMLGEPSFVTEEVYGSGTAAGAWRGLEWLYAFNRFMARPKRLYVFFRSFDGEWRLDHWQWGNLRD